MAREEIETNELAQNRPPRHGRRVSEVQDTTRRWSGYVCPECRFVFRVPRDHDGEGAVCPSCSRLLRLPGKDDVLPALVAPERRLKSSGSDDRKARGRSHYEQAKPEWERADAANTATSPEFRRKHMLAWVIGGLVIAAVGFGLLLRQGKDHPVPVMVIPPVGPSLNESVESVPALTPPKDFPTFKRETEDVAKRFLEAKTVAALAPETPKPEQTAARATQLFPDGKIDAPGFSYYVETSEPVHDGAHSTVQVKTRYQGVRPLTLVHTDAGWKVDWESWSGWSDVTWADALAQRPTKVIRLRATVSPVEYYNFYFTDEARWQSFKLESPDGDQLLYGYAERDSELAVKLTPPAEQTSMRLLVEVRFPGDPSARNQVFISRVVNTNWTDFDDSGATP